MAGRTQIWIVTAALLCGLLISSGAAANNAATFAAVAGPESPASYFPDNSGGSQAAGSLTSATFTGTWRSGGPYGGDVQALALSPDFGHDGLALAGGWRTGWSGYAGGYGFARTTDAGATWALVFDGPPWAELAVFDLAISPGFIADSTAFAATAAGVLRSTDRGVTWERLADGLPGPGNDSTVDDMGFVRLSPDFIADGAILTAVRNGSLYRSTDRGATWARVLTGPVFTAAFSRDFMANQTAFAAQFDGIGATNLVRSTDRGQSWATVLSLPGVQVNDMLETYEDVLLLATGDGVMRLVPADGGYVEEPVSPDIEGPVYRLAAAGDHLYAAAQSGLFITLTEGRRWDRYADTPEIPFLTAAPCPVWGNCHALMAGTHNSLIGTPDDNLAPWAWLPGPHPLRAEGVATSPAYTADGTLFAATDHGLYRSTDRGLSWQLKLAGQPPDLDYTFKQVRLSAGYATDGTVFATYLDRTGPWQGLYKSTDRGETWAVQWGIAGALALSPAYPVDRTLFVGQDDQVRKSTDGGATWTTYPIGTPGDGFFVFDLKTSPAYGSDRTLFATGFGRARRSTDGGATWQALNTYGPSYGLAVSPNYAADGTVWHTYRAIEGPGDGTPESGVLRTTDRGAIWSFATAGLPGTYEPFPLPLAASPAYVADRALFTALSGQFVTGNSHSLYRAQGGGNYWVEIGPAPGNPNPTELAVTANPGGELTAHMATWAGVWHYSDRCEERLANGGFETNDAWQIPVTAYSAGYSTAVVHSGRRSLRTGVVTVPDVYSYSSANQSVTIPAGVAGATLTFWWYPISAEGPLAAEETPSREVLQAAAGTGPSAALARSETGQSGSVFSGEGADEALAGDRQYALLLDSTGNIIASLLWTRSDARSWQYASFNVAAYAGRTIRVLFGTYNDGNGRSTAMYVDDASLTVCWPAPVEPTPTPTATRTPGPTSTPTVTSTPQPMQVRGYLPLIFKRYALPLPPTATATPSATRTPSRTATPSPTASPSRTATSTATPRPTLTPSATASPTGTPTATASPTRTPSATASPTGTATVTPSPSATASPTGTVTPGFLHPRWLRSLVAAPGEPGRLVGLTNEGYLVSSTDRGETWETVPLPPEVAGTPLTYRGYVGMDYNHPQTLYLGAVSQGLWRSTDGGATWQKIHTLPAGPVTVSLLNLADLWAGLVGPNDLHAVIARSNDAGLTWAATTGELMDDPVSPILIDPQAPNVVYAVTSGLRGGAMLSRTFDGQWQRIPNAPFGTPLGGGPGLGLALDAGTRGLYLAGTDGQLYVSFNAFTPNLNDVLWQPVHQFESAYLPIPLAVGALPPPYGGLRQPYAAEAIPYTGAIYLTLFDWTTWHGRTLRSDDGGITWTPLTIPAPAVTPTPTPTRTITPSATPSPTNTQSPIPATPTPTPTGVPGLTCYEGLVNGGFETDAGWIIRANPAPAAYVTTPVHTGARSMRTGIAAGGANVESYSPIEQSVTFPGALASVELSFWRYNVYGDGGTAEREYNSRTAEALPDLADLPRTEAELADAVFATDFFYVIAIRPDSTIDWLLVERTNNPTWRVVPITLDASRYAGQTIRFQFGTYNNGTGGLSRTYLDDVFLRVCPPAGALVLPAGWARRVIGRPEQNRIYADVGGVLYRSDDAGEHWWTAGATARPEQTIMNADPSVLYAGDGYPCYRGGDPVPMWRTTDGGMSWHQLPAGLNLKPLAAHSADYRLYAAGCDGPYFSPAMGASFIHQPDPLFGIYDAKYIAPVEPGWTDVWVGGISEGGGGAVLVSRNGGDTFAISYPQVGQPEMGWLGETTLDRFTAGRVYAPALYGFFYTPDNGTTWLNNSQGLEDVVDPGTGDRRYGLLALAQDPVDPGHRLYLGTVRGLYTRDPGTALWYKINGQLYDQMEVNDLLVLDGAPRRLYVTTPLGVFVYNLNLLPPAPTLTPTPSVPPSATPTRTPTRPSPTPTATTGPSPTPTPTMIPTATPGVWPTPRLLASLSLPAGSHPHGVVLNPTGYTVYLAFHGADHSGRELGVVSTDPLGLLGTVSLSDQATGPNGLTLVDPTGPTVKVAVANRQTDDVAVVEVVSRSIIRRIPAADMPDGVITQGNFGYVANFGNDTVTVFDHTTLDVIRTLHVGHEPSLFAADPTTGDVYLSLHGSNQVMRLHDGAVAGLYNAIAAPYGLAFDPASRRLYVANRGGANTVTVIDVISASVVGTIGVGKEPFVLAVNPDSGNLFVVCGDEVKVYRTLDWAPVVNIPVPVGAEEGIALDNIRDRVYVTSREGDALTVIQDAAPPLVLFASNRDAGNGEIYRMLPDGRQQIRLTFTADAYENTPVGSPDGRWIAYERAGADGPSHLWLMSRDGRNPRQLTFGTGYDYIPTWSPDGTKLAFTSDRDGNWEIYTVRVADGAVTRLTFNSAADQGPNWSWAIGRIAFQSNRYGPNPEIFRMEADGTNPVRLTVNPNGDAGPSWSPAGDRILFFGTRAEQTLYVMRADGFDIVPLVSRNLRPGGSSWAPAGAGNFIAFSGFRPGSGHSEIFRVAPDGSGLVLLTFNEVDFDYAPGWLPGV
jgi:YVTN family beta-propeller protein